MLSLDQIEFFGKGVLKSEGVVVDKDGYVYGGGRNGKVYRVDPEGKTEELFQLPERHVPNGITLDRNGDIIICDVGQSAVLRATLKGQLSLVADQIDDVKLITPNFPTFDAEGNLYVSNTMNQTWWEMLQSPPDRNGPGGAVVRIRPNGKGEVAAREVKWANGLAIDPKEEAVYALRTNSGDCVRIPINKDGTHGAPETYVSGIPGIVDGMAFAADGSLFITVPGVPKRPDEPAEGSIVNSLSKIVKAPPGGGSFEIIFDDPGVTKLDKCTNCAFGGPGLKYFYMANCNGDSFSRAEIGYVGHPLYHQR